MVDIVSGSGEPRAQDLRVKRLIDDNRDVITRLADQISGGRFSQQRAHRAAAAAAPPPVVRRHRRAIGDDADPVLNLSRNGRLIILDRRSGQQMFLLGQLRRRDGRQWLSLATAENGFVGTLRADLAQALAPVDGFAVDGERGEQQLLAAVETLIGEIDLAPTDGRGGR